jgi:hypothetical protein
VTPFDVAKGWALLDPSLTPHGEFIAEVSRGYLEEALREIERLRALVDRFRMDETRHLVTVAAGDRWFEDCAYNQLIPLALQHQRETHGPLVPGRYEIRDEGWGMTFDPVDKR